MWISCFESHFLGKSSDTVFDPKGLLPDGIFPTRSWPHLWLWNSEWWSSTASRAGHATPRGGWVFSPVKGLFYRGKQMYWPVKRTVFGWKTNNGRDLLTGVVDRMFLLWFFERDLMNMCLECSLTKIYFRPLKDRNQRIELWKHRKSRFRWHTLRNHKNDNKLWNIVKEYKMTHSLS